MFSNMAIHIYDTFQKKISKQGEIYAKAMEKFHVTSETGNAFPCVEKCGCFQAKMM